VGTSWSSRYELSVASKLIVLFLILAVGLFGLSGFILGFVIHFLYLVNLKSLRTPYLWPFIPFNPYAMFHVLFRVPTPYTNIRPRIVHPKNNYRQPTRKSYTE